MFFVVNGVISTSVERMLFESKKGNTQAWIQYNTHNNGKKTKQKKKRQSEYPTESISNRNGATSVSQRHTGKAGLDPWAGLMDSGLLQVNIRSVPTNSVYV